MKLAINDLKTAQTKDADKKARKELDSAREERVEAKKAELEAIDDLKDAQDDKVRIASKEPTKDTVTAEETE